LINRNGILPLCVSCYWGNHECTCVWRDSYNNTWEETQRSDSQEDGVRLPLDRYVASRELEMSTLREILRSLKVVLQ